MRKREQEPVTIDAPDGTQLHVELPPRHVYALVEVVFLSVMALAMTVPTEGTWWSVLRVLSLYLWGLGVIYGAYHRGMRTAMVEHAIVMEAIAAVVQQHERELREQQRED